MRKKTAEPPVEASSPISEEEVKALRALIPPPPRLYVCGLCLTENFERDVETRSLMRSRNKSTIIDGVEVCLNCSYYADFADNLDTLKDLAVAKLLGFSPGTFLVGSGELLPAPPPGQGPSNVPFAWVDVEALAHAFDLRYSAEAPGKLEYPNAELQPIGYRNSDYLVLGQAEYVPSVASVSKSPLRPATKNENAKALKEMLQQNRAMDDAKRALQAERRIERAKKELANALAVRVGQ